ncbi:MAG: hypothetical protein ACTSXJ_04555 [Candidatus Baldrarchaeia archaeon]
MPAVELLARALKDIQSTDPDLSLVDLIIILWLYASPYETKRRYLSSIKRILRHVKEFQLPDGRLLLSDEELSNLVLSSLKKLEKKGYVAILSCGNIYVRACLTPKAISFVRRNLSDISLEFLEEYGHLK